MVDTNVLIAASATLQNSPMALVATPEDFDLRYEVWKWLTCFSESCSRLVLDGQQEIDAEYRHKLMYPDYGLQVVQNKWDTLCVDMVDVSYDRDGYAVLEEPLLTVIHDRADRKMVAAAQVALCEYGFCAIAFAADSDWHEWEESLYTAGLQLEPIIEGWSRSKHLEKKSKK